MRKARLAISPATEISPPPADEAARERARERRLGNLRGQPSSRRRALLPELDGAAGAISACASVDVPSECSPDHEEEADTEQ